MVGVNISPSARLPAVVLGLCFVLNFVSRGLGDTYLVFLLPLGQEFGWYRAEMTGVYSALMVCAGLSAPLAGMVFERWGPRVLYTAGLLIFALGYLLAGHASALWHFYLCIGILGGMGGGALGMVPASALLSWWFTRRMSTAIGIAYAGFGFGSLVMVPFAQTLIDGYGWRNAYLSFGLLLLAVAVLSQALPWKSIAAPQPPRRGSTAQSAFSSSLLWSALGQRPFWLLVQVMFFTALGMYLILVQSISYLVDVGFTPLQAASAFGAAGMLSVVGVSSSGWFVDLLSHKAAATASIVGTMLGIALLYLLSFGSSAPLLIGYVVLFGSCQGARGPVVASLCARHFAGRGQATVYGLIYAFMSMGAGLGAFMSGLLHDITGGYGASFALAVVCFALAAMPFWVAKGLAPARPSKQEGQKALIDSSVKHDNG
jgi:MFS family permease